MTLPLSASESRFVDYVQANVAPYVGARASALVTWWALKEGILDLPNPWRHNLCTRDGRDVKLGDLDVCPGSAWQIGMSGIQAGAVSLAEAEAVAVRFYGSVPAALSKVVAEADVDNATRSAVLASDGDLRKAWLLRDPVISFTLQAPFVEKGCITGTHGWCYGSWPTALTFAKDRSVALQVVSELERRFSAKPLEPSPKKAVPWLPILAVASVAGFYYFHKGRR